MVCLAVQSSATRGPEAGLTNVVVNIEGTGTPGHSEWKKLPHGPLECEDLMKEMFDIVDVDGSSSCIPGEVVGGGTGRGVGEGIYEMDGETNT
ncbi:hypothetical protein GUJ93_ZPchr0029g29033 [Zizania palustris]|uniref:Uncharacterized protein n=1 Tax=Zizania palustris TaxID=103762 RepID=A0A8J5QYF8_ZIZPA|nr:hypothetical protein GUJ93_ZPchr0029g29033 [Zizania palustris]